MADDETIQFPQSDATTGFGVAVKSKSSTGDFRPTGSAPAALQPGTVLGGRYEILQMLGEGGMGAVYKARDNAVDRLIALKIIRPDLVGNDAILQRFKQELILARQVTHKNVIRIYDLGSADGLMFITMEYVEGQDLRSLLKDHGKLPVADAVDITIQILSGLQVAHAEGVIHRDLKPGNIMRDPQGRIIVMDFGLARTLGGDGMTQTGMMLGTIEYMSPEQAQAKELDARSDLFTVGLIFYELITGATPFKAETALASLVKRTQERAVAVSTIEPSVDRRISAIIAKCLEREPAQRYQNAQQIIHDLEAWKAGKAAGSLGFPSLGDWGRGIRWEWIAVALAVVVLGVAGYFVEGKVAKRGSKTAVVTPAAPEVSLAILPFRNASGDATLDWLGPSLAEMLTADVGQSARLRTVSANRLHQIFNDLKISAVTELDPATVQRVANFSSADHVIWGQYVKIGDQIRIDVTLQDLKKQRSVSLKAEAANENALLQTVSRLAESVQQNLALSQDAIQQLRAAVLKPSSQSVLALRYYNEGIQLASQGKNQDAVKQFEAAIKEDPQFALAYSRLGQSYARLGYDDKAAEFSGKAAELSNDLPPQERYLILANRALAMNDNQKAIEAYESLTKVSPEDTEIELNLAQVYENVGSYDKSREYLSKIVARDPKNIEALLTIGDVEIHRKNPQGALDYLNQALSLRVELENAQAKASALHLTGLAFRRLGKLSDALRNHQEALAIRRQIDDKRGTASSLAEIARVQEQLGKRDLALKNYQEALQLRREIGDKTGMADVLIDLGNFHDVSGKYDEALKLHKEALQLQRELGDPAGEANSLNNVGIIYSEKGQYEDGLTYFQQSLQLREKIKIPADIEDSEQNIAYTYSLLGQFDEAINHYLRALDLARSTGNRQAAATFSHNLATVFEYQGRYGAALKAKEEALNILVQLQQRGYWLAAVLSSYGNELSLVGRFEEADKKLNEALSVARENQSDPIVAQTLNFQGDRFFYLGDYKAARSLYQQASDIALRMKDLNLRLISKANLGKVDVREGRFRQATSALREVVRQYDAAGLKYSSVESSLYLGDALLNDKNPSAAQRELQDALRRSEKLGSRMLLAKSHYLLGTTLRVMHQDTEASAHFEQARRILDEIRKEVGRDSLLQRSDLRPIVAEARH